jgi:hypothetical protein
MGDGFVAMKVGKFSQREKGKIVHAPGFQKEKKEARLPEPHGLLPVICLWLKTCKLSP